MKIGAERLLRACVVVERKRNAPMISHFAVSATDLMATSLGMSGLAILVPMLATVLFVASMSMAGTSLMMSAGRVLIGFFLSKIWMVSLLSMLALYNAIGGGAATAIAAAEMFDSKISGTTQLVEALIVALVGAVSLSGSLIAWIKINGLIEESSRIWGRQALSLVVIVIVLAVASYIATTVNGGANRSMAAPALTHSLLGCALLFGALITLRLRRAHMPILLSLYNAFTGLAIGLEGLILQNHALLIVGIMIGTARVFVTLMMVERWPSMGLGTFFGARVPARGTDERPTRIGIPSRRRDTSDLVNSAQSSNSMKNISPIPSEAAQRLDRTDPNEGIHATLRLGSPHSYC